MILHLVYGRHSPERRPVGIRFSTERGHPILESAQEFKVFLCWGKLIRLRIVDLVSGSGTDGKELDEIILLVLLGPIRVSVELGGIQDWADNTVRPGWDSESRKTRKDMYLHAEVPASKS